MSEFNLQEALDIEPTDMVDWTKWLDEVENLTPSGFVDEDLIDTYYDMFIQGWPADIAAKADLEDHIAFLD